MEIRRFVVIISALYALALSVSARADSWTGNRSAFAPPAAPSAAPTNAKKRKTRETAPADSWRGDSPLEAGSILLGAKAGLQVTSYTDITQSGKTGVVPNGMGYVAGATLLWNVGLPRLEADVFVHDRQQGIRIPVVYVGFPLLVKFNVAENKRVSWQAGTGVQMDLAVSGGSTRRNVAFGLPIATDLLVRLDAGPVLDFEARYNFGMQTYDGGTTGGWPRDLDLLVAFMLPLDQTGF